MPQIISRKEAKALGLKRYFTGAPCKRGHIVERFLNARCVECNKFRPANRFRYARNPEKRREHHRSYRNKHRTEIRAKGRDRQQKISDLIAVLRKEMPDLLKEFGL